jgi:hypothetical protein
MSEKKVDYDIPFVLEAIFRESGDEAGLEMGERLEEIAALWFDVIGLRTYPFPDEKIWDKYKGKPKFIIVLRDQGSFVVLGEFKHMLRLWKAFTKEYYGKNPND